MSISGRLAATIALAFCSACGPEDAAAPSTAQPRESYAACMKRENARTEADLAVQFAVHLPDDETVRKMSDDERSAGLLKALETRDRHDDALFDARVKNAKMCRAVVG